MGDNESSTPALVPAILYLRFSPKPEHAISQDTIDVQREICHRYCKYRGLNPLVELADELVSARCVPMLDRPQGSKIPELVGRGIKDIVAVRLDRMFRDTVDGLNTFTAWEKAGVAIHFAEGGNALNCASPQGKLLLTMLLGVASYEPGIIAERTSASMLHKQRSGRIMTAADRIPWGYEVDPDSPKHERSGKPMGMRPCLHEREISEAIRTLRGADLPYSAIASQLNTGRTTCRGKHWDHAKVKRALNAKWED